MGGGTATNGVRAGNGLITISCTTPVNDQLSTLLMAVTGVGSGKSLADKVKLVQAYVRDQDHTRLLKAGHARESKRGRRTGGPSPFMGCDWFTPPASSSRLDP